eukprot:9054070-Pyramimonas_sp.AAC.1
MCDASHAYQAPIPLGRACPPTGGFWAKNLKTLKQYPQMRDRPDLTIPLLPGPLPGRVRTRISRRIQQWRREPPRRPTTWKSGEGLAVWVRQ